MASEVVIRLLDDIDGTEASETVRFSLDGVAFEIDLTEAHAMELRDALGVYVGAARMVPTAKRARKASTDKAPGEAKLARVWLQANGYEISDRGRIPEEMMRAYQGRLEAVEAPTVDDSVEAPPAAEDASQGEDKPDLLQRVEILESELHFADQDSLSEEELQRLRTELDEARQAADAEVVRWHEAQEYKISLKGDGRPNGLMVSRYRKAHAAA